MSHAPGSFCWFECGSTDAAASKEFYKALFGWEAVDVPMPNMEGAFYTLLQSGGADMAGLYQLDGPQFEGVPSHWMSYVNVESADDSAGRAKELGATVLQEPMDVPGVGRMAFLMDPDGASFALFQPGEHQGHDPEKCILGWTELHTRDKEASKNFYASLFDWGVKEDPDGIYTEFQVGDRSIAGMMEIPPEQQSEMPPNWLPYAMVDDCDACMTRAAELGAQTLVPPTDIENVGRFGVLADPAGAAIAVIRLDEHGEYA